jgi:uncharacterized tellurite resistance protein B-like protein
MALPTQIEFLKVLACMAWADEKVTRAEISLIGRLMHDFHLSGEERMQVEMYLDEKVDSEEARRVTRRFLARLRRAAERKQLVTTVEKLLDSDDHRTPEEREWLQELNDAVAESSGSFLLDGLRSVLRIGATGVDRSDSDEKRNYTTLFTIESCSSCANVSARKSWSERQTPTSSKSSLCAPRFLPGSVMSMRTSCRKKISSYKNSSATFGGSRLRWRKPSAASRWKPQTEAWIFFA